MTFRYLVEHADFSFVYSFQPSGDPPAIDPADLDRAARAEVAKSVASNPFAISCSGSRLCEGNTEDVAMREVSRFVATELSKASSPQAPLLDILPTPTVYWRPVPPFHQIIGSVTEKNRSGASNPSWWRISVPIGTQTVDAFVCVTIEVRKLV